MTRDRTKEPGLAFIDAVTEPHKDEAARRALQENLQMWHRSGVAPLWLNTFRHRAADVRLACLVQDFHKFNTLLQDEVRSVEGVRQTRTAFGFHGVANMDLLLDLEMEVLPDADASTCYLNLRVAPGADHQVLAAVHGLPGDAGVGVVWALNTFNSHVGDLSLLLLGEDRAAISRFVMSDIRSIEGVVDTVEDEIVEWLWMADADAIIAVCEMFAANQDADAADDLDLDGLDEYL